MATSTATAVEELPVSYHGFCLGYDGVWRFKIPDDVTGTETDLKIEPVFTCDTHLLPINMGFFGSGHKVYILSGEDDRPTLHLLDPEKEFGVKNPQFLYQPTILPCNKFEPLMSPVLIHANNQIYFLTQYTSPWFGKPVENICFQSFDPNKNIFRNLPSPTKGKGTDFRVAAHFAALGYIYLFIQENRDKPQMDEFSFTRGFSFNTKTSEWREEPKSMRKSFRKNNIPIPYLHRGDTLVSKQFANDTRILVALCDSIPTAYCVTLGEDGSLIPKSFRNIAEIESRNPTDLVQLHDIGGGRFCTICESFMLPLNVSVFKIDFRAEYRIQCSKKDSSGRISSVLLCSKIFLEDTPSFYAYCLASAPPASQSSGNQIAAAEVQDRDGNLGKKKKKRMRDDKKKNNGQAKEGQDK